MPETARTDRSLPRPLDRYATWGVAALLAGVPLGLAAFVTNPVPDPSFPWATLPDALRLAYSQPRIEHWPVSYTLAVWLWILGFPALFLAGYRRYGARLHEGASVWLVTLPATAMLAWTTYCRFFWPKPHPPTWNAPSYTFVCWLYCSSYDPVWSNLAYAVAALGVVTAVLARRDGPIAAYALAAFGTLSLPLGLPVLYELRRRRGA